MRMMRVSGRLERSQVQRRHTGLVAGLVLVLELVVEILAEGDVLEHALELARVLEPARVLELGDHARLGVVRGRRLVDESPREHARVELLEHVLVLDVLKDAHLLRATGSVQARDEIVSKGARCR